MHLVDLSVNVLGTTPIVGSSLPVAVGTAFATAMRGRDEVSVVFFGEGATEEGVFSESINFAALKSLPVIFVCENNFYSVYSPLSVRQPAARDRLAIARAHGIATGAGDGNDVEHVYRTTKAAVDAVRAGHGPYYLEFETYRFREHCGPNFDNNIGYRTEEEFLEWRARCPVETYQRRLASELGLPASELTGIREALTVEINDAFELAKNSPWPDPAQAFANVYAEEPGQ
jgi:pyruvate dehydrogenase E1 component alpha subunit